MEQCAFCGAQLPADASFCGTCGRVPSKDSHQATLVRDGSIPLRNESDEQPTIQHAGNLPEKNQLSSVGHRSLVFSDEIDEQPTVKLPNASEATLMIEPGAAGMPQENTPTMLLPLANPASLDEETDEEEAEEKRRRAALLGFGMPLLGALADAAPEQIPSLPGAPQIAQVPTLQGAPQIAQPGMVPGQALEPGTPALPGPGTPIPAPSSPAPGSSPPTSLPGSSGSPGSGSAPGGSGSPGSSPGGPSGCLVAAILVITTLMVILTSITVLGLTVWAPGLTLSGSSIVSPGSTLMLHGTNFLPNSSVDLTLDSNTPLYYLQRIRPARLARVPIRQAESVSQLFQFLAQGKRTVVIQGNGTFTISVPVNPAWPAGRHTIHASETLTHRSTSLTFTIVLANATATPTPSPMPTGAPAATPSPTPTPTATPLSAPTPAPTKKPTPTPTPTPPILSINPTSVDAQAGPPCTWQGNYSYCLVNVTNKSHDVPLTWSAKTSQGITVQARSHTIPAGSTEQVTVVVPFSDCTGTGASITTVFVGPANSADFVWKCAT